MPLWARLPEFCARSTANTKTLRLFSSPARSLKKLDIYKGYSRNLWFLLYFVLYSARIFYPLEGSKFFVQLLLMYNDKSDYKPTWGDKFYDLRWQVLHIWRKTVGRLVDWPPTPGHFRLGNPNS